MRVVAVAVLARFFVVAPRAVQTFAAGLYPTPSKAQFDAELEAETREHGDSHNPNDPKFAALKAETLARYGVKEVKDLPFNYGGFVMSKSEETSSAIFRRRYNETLAQFRRQNRLGEAAGLLNPFLAVRHFSMAMAASDLANYESFQRQAEDYRYRMVQRLNELHTHEIKFENDRAQKVSREVWDDFPPFRHEPPAFAESFAGRALSVAALALWLAAAFGALVWLRPRRMI